MPAIEAPQTFGAVGALNAVDHALVRRILDLDATLDELDGRHPERDNGAGKATSECSVRQRQMLLAGRGQHALGLTVRQKHDGVLCHGTAQRRRNAL